MARRWWMRAVTWPVAGVVLLTGALACGLGSGSRSPQTAPQPTPTQWPVGDRHSKLDVGDRQEPRDIEFADANVGYALFYGYSTPAQPAVLFGTADGGRTWQRLPFDPGDTDYHFLLTVNASTLVISGKGRYHVSRDGGKSFTVSATYPRDLEGPLNRRATLRCKEKDADGRCTRMEVAKEERFVPQQPPLRDDVDAVAEDAQGRIWAVASAQDGVFTAVSADAGTSWTLVPDVRTARRIDRVRLVTSDDGRELWLLASDVDGELTAFVPDGLAWRKVAEEVRPDFDADLVCVAGEGVLALGGDGFGYLRRDGVWRPVTAPRNIDQLSTLADGTLTAKPKGSTNGIWLGPGKGADRTWVYVTVEPV